MLKGGAMPGSNSPEDTHLSALPSFPATSAFLESALPGRSARMKRLRRQILEFAANPTAKAVLLRGPIGVGKSTIARLIALLKRVAPLSADKAKEFLSLVPFNGPFQVDVRYLSTWYVELSLTGLVETLAESQLFGSGEGSFSDAEERAGVFEAASRGRVAKGKEEPVGARVTKGVVFLDEIGDLSEKLQAKLLPVLSGNVFYRVGTEGKNNAELEFRGITITASWRELTNGRLRPDLLSRIAPYVIDVPGVDERIDDFDFLLDGIEHSVLRILRRSIEELSTTDPHVDRGYWRRRIDDLKPLKQTHRDFLRQVPWESRANLRGLTAAIEQIIATGAEPEAIVASLPTSQPSHAESNEEDSLLRQLIAQDRTGGRLGTHVKAIERERRRSLRVKLQSDRTAFAQLSEVLGIEPEQLRIQLRDIDRDRRTAEDDP
jgi:DNA-binding NtrC family response regulator